MFTIYREKEKKDREGGGEKEKGEEERGGGGRMRTRKGSHRQILYRKNGRQSNKNGQMTCSGVSQKKILSGP